MIERITLKEEMRLKKERWPVEEQLRHVQEEHHKMSIKAEQKCLQEVPAQDEMYEEKEEISVDVIKDKDDLNPVILSKERMNLYEDEIEKEKPKNLAEQLPNYSKQWV
ncbi:hypothetical protein TNCV_4085411 [Trichonephila clavipes]|nr:hypothetical protein TNCV_4085411 [Trichonephila clavipes]